MERFKDNFKIEKKIILFSIFYRTLIIFLLKGGPYFKAKSNLYTEMLNQNFLDFISYEHTKPVLFYIKDFFAFKIIPYNYSLANFLLITSLDIIAVVIYYQLILKISDSLKLSIFFSILLSISFVTWEYWREASHFDHLNIFIFAIFLHSSYLISKGKYILYYLLSLILISCLHSFGIIFSFLSIVFNYRKLKKTRIIIVLLIVCFSYFIAVNNNIQIFKTPLLSTVGGQNQLQFVWNSKDAEKAIIEKIKISSNYPYWYKSCFLKAYNNEGKYGSIYGKCIPAREGNSSEIKKFLLSIYSNSRDKYLRSYISNDLKILDNSFHFDGGVEESKLGFSVYYGKYSGKLAKEILKENPLLIFNPLARSIYSGLSSALFFTGLYYEPQLIKLPIFHKIANFLISTFLFWGIIFSIINSTLFFTKFYLKNKFNKIIKNLEFKESEINYLIANSSFFMTLNFFLFSISTCCENSRMMVGVLPYSILSIVGISLGFLKKRKIIFPFS